MAENDDVQLVESISGIDGTSPTSNVQNMHMHGSVGASSTITTLDHVDIAITSNYVVLVSNSTKVEM
jgi:hypothetical protein